MPAVKPKPENVASLILLLRGEKVLLSEHLAGLYGVSVKVLNQAVKRNIGRFPDDFMFQLTRSEVETVFRSRSQFVTLNRGQNIKYLPYAFTDKGRRLDPLAERTFAGEATECPVQTKLLIHRTSHFDCAC